MDKLFEFVAGILPDFVALLCPNLEENTESLQRKIRSLESRKRDVHEDLQSHSGKKRKREVEDWMDNVENIIKDFETLEQRVQQSSRFYHVFKRQKLAEQLESMTEEVKELFDQGEFPSGPSFDVDESINQLLLIPQPNGRAFRKNVDGIWTSLMDVNVVSIGIYGMGGVGKTTLARCVHDKLKKSTFSDNVYWVTVSQEFSIYKLQSDIAKQLKLDNITDENEEGRREEGRREEGRRAARLFQEFQKMERFVLILDDVWKRIDAEKIGIPSKKDGCQLVITSRSEEVCRSMCGENIIKVKTLSEKEAWNLFSKTFDRDEVSAEVEDICKQMVSRCKGLPLALITLAGSMRSVIDIHEWRYALEGLKVSCLGRADMEDELLPILLYSYHRLRDPRLKSCFLYCSLYPEDSSMSRDDLIRSFISEELMERELSLKAQIDQGHAILNQLVRACLLERVSYGRLKMHDLIREMAIGITKEKPRYMVKAGLHLKELPEEQLVRACLLENDSYGDLKMHDLIREMAIRITKDNPRYMVKAGLHLKELPEEQEWTEDLDKVSLMHNSIMEISDGTSPKCPSLSTLILSNNPLRSIPDCFFTHMCGLRTLNLSVTDIESLPNSISDLEKLNALLLGGCKKLVSVPSLEKLKVLKHLDLSSTNVKEIPRGMESLTNLKSLSLLHSTFNMIPGTLYRLTHLQQLKLPYYFEVPIEEVEALKQLEVLQCTLNSVRDLNRLINSRQSDKQFLSYNITLGSRALRFNFSNGKHLYFGQKSLMEFSLDTDGNTLPQDVESLFFMVSGLRGCLLDEFPIPNSVRVCNIYKEDKIECIMRLDEAFSWVPFQSLERLKLEDLPNLIGLFKWEAVLPLPPGTFSCLKELRIDGCGKIKKLFPQSLVHNFHNLQFLKVFDCVQMEEIIEDDNNGRADITLPMLKSLSLHNLPQVKSICKGKMICDNIELILFVGIKNIKKLPLYLPFLNGQLSPPPRLRAIIIKERDKEWWESLEWPHHNANNVLQPLVKFRPSEESPILTEYFRQYWEYLCSQERKKANSKAGD